MSSKVVFIAVVFAACGLIISASPGNAQAGKPDKLLVSAIPDMTGPYAAIVGPAYAAFQDAAEYVNDNGGVKGVPIEVIVRDCGGKVDKGVNIYMQYREMKPRPLIVFGVISGVGEALRERFNEDKFPAMWVSSTSLLYPAMYTFGSYPTYADLCGLFIDWAAETWKGKKPARLAFLTWDTTYGKAVMYDEVFDHAKSKGINVVAKEYFGIRDVDLTSQLTRIRAKKADFVFTNTAGRGPAMIAKAMKEMG
ncbi:MAG: ABC transporter substrate-binding protein, partial [Thermodesulfobacteriota bacterium]|nr:ABC transporter substrate-binding protein [Thermodesulfobacteriota bacterium]